jgi:hypothetical protein
MGIKFNGREIESLKANGLTKKAIFIGSPTPIWSGLKANGKP